MLTCKELTELVTDYAEGNLSFVDRLRFRVHIGMCRDCRRYVRQVKATAAALGALPVPELSPDLEQELLRRFDDWKQTRRS
ncbi:MULTISPECIES: anti-sigma factor [Anaeromyxobacter]|uniref:anti-sigma factor family protein n=1 Tax=Anaeromyxobacter TaxID=161492 RepID=UPI001F5835F4|nr:MULTISPECIES: zf-HC2 domain-containing protein [unclassified Anaeromyxobacter]